MALNYEEGRCWQEMLDTPPTTAAGLALALAAFCYAIEGSAAGAHFHDPESWYLHGIDGAGGTAYRMLPALWRSPAAAELFKDIPAGDPKGYLAERERSIEAFDKAVAEAEARPHEPTWGEVRGAMIASEAAGKPISEDEAVALLRAHGTREAA